MSSPPLFELAGIGKRFGHHWILQDISFSIDSGDFLLLLGNNGAGKSTLMKVLSSLMRPSAGELSFRGIPFRKSTADLRASTGIISHQSQFYGDLTAPENLRVFGTLYSVDNLKERIPDALRELRLDSFPNVPVRAFSSGMLKRLAFARIALFNPQVLLLDEPHAGLDQESVRLLDDFLHRFKAGGGTTLMITHQFTGAVEACNRILILNNGGLVYNEDVKGVSAERCAALLKKTTAPRKSA